MELVEAAETGSEEVRAVRVEPVSNGRMKLSNKSTRLSFDPCMALRHTPSVTPNI